MTIQPADRVAGIHDTVLVHDATDFTREAEDDLLFHHSRRVLFLGARQGSCRGLQPHLEVLYVGAMFHDLGLTERDSDSSTLRFEVNGADAAREFLLRRGIDEADARKVWLSIAMHRTPGVPEFLDPELAFVTAGVETEKTLLQRAFEDWKSFDKPVGARIEDAVRTPPPNGSHTTEWRARPEFQARQANS